MNIIQVSFGRYPLPLKGAGGEMAVYYLSEYLARIPECKVKLIDLKSSLHKKVRTSFSFCEVSNIPIKENSAVSHIMKLTLFAIFVVIKIFLLRLREKINIVHIHNQFSGFFVVLMKTLFGGNYKTVYTIHNHEFVMYPKINFFRNPFELFILKNVDHISAMTPSVKTQLVKRFKLPEGKITQVYHGVNIEEIEKFISENKKIVSEEKIIVYLARVCKRKNQFVIVQSMKKIIEKFPETKCIFIGPVEEKDYFAKIVKFAEENKFENKILFYGEVKRETVYKLLLNSTISVVSSLYETQGLMLIESMAFGLPVIASKIGPFIDVVRLEPESAILVDPFNVEEISEAVIKLFSDDELRKKMSIKAKQLAEKFSWDKIANDTLSLYREVLLKKKTF